MKESPLNGMNIGNLATVAMRELPGLPALDLRVAPGTLTQAIVSKALGADLRGTPGKALPFSIPGGLNAHALCLAPDWWLIVGYEEAGQQLAPLQLKDQYHFSAVDVSGQGTTIELEGPKVRELLAHLWEQDLRDKSFPALSVSQGLMAKAPVILFRIAPFRFRVMVRSSFALHLWKALEDAGEEWV